MQTSLCEWTVDYGLGPSPVTVPHAWRQDVPVGWEGPAIYRAAADLPEGPGHILFHGVSYAAKVRLGGRQIVEHHGIWDAFSVPVPGGRTEIEVEVVKNGGTTYPVKAVASGFLPYVFNTFGGIFREVEYVPGPEDPLGNPTPAPPSRLAVDGRKIFVDGRPFYVRGVLTWGWYPELGHANPSEETCRREARQAKRLGFNLIKFCLWVPPHRYLEILREEGLEAWLELPLWDPSPEPGRLEAIATEIERIVVQYRRHDNILLWTVGCELSSATPADYRRSLVEMVKRHTGCPLVKDNSGGAEMYGGDLREFGDFYDFHPYCETPFYAPVLDSLETGPRTPMPVLLGEFNDVDVHRDLARVKNEAPYWASSAPALNAQGVRWQFDLPRIMEGSRFASSDSREAHERLLQESKSKAVAMRKAVQEAVRAREWISGYVVTGHRDTPISTAGVIDDWGCPRFHAQDLASWNASDVLFLIPTRRPPWVDGGNRPGLLDSYNHFEGPIFLKVGLHSERGLGGHLRWRVVDEAGTVVASGSGDARHAGALESRQVGEVCWAEATAGAYELEVRFGHVRNQWPIWVVRRPDWRELGGWTLVDPGGLLAGVAPVAGDDVLGVRPPEDLAGLLEAGRRVALFLVDDLAKPAPFWREAAYEFLDDRFWTRIGFRNRWERLLAVSGDRVVDLEALVGRLPRGAQVEVLMNRIDVRTYAEAPVMVRARCGKGRLIATTLRPFGGLGTQPFGVSRNPAGAALLAGVLRELGGA
jgi:hypothetical protein